LGVKKIEFKDMVKSDMYYAIGGIRFYDKSDTIIPIVFADKDKLTTNNFTVTGSNTTGVVETTNSYGTYYFIDSPFDTTKLQDGGYSGKGYWLSQSATEISITFDTPVSNIFRIEYNPKPDSQTNRNLNSLTIEITDKLNSIVFNEVIDTSALPNNIVQSIEVKSPTQYKILLLSDNGKNLTFKDRNNQTDGVLTPPMSSDSEQGVTINSSHVYVSNEAFMAFDKDYNTVWRVDGIAYSDLWIQCDFNHPTLVDKLGIKISGTSVYIMRDFKLQGSNDGLVFDDLYTGRYVSTNEMEYYEIDNSIFYKIYRLKPLTGADERKILIGEIEFYGSYSNTLTALPSSSEESFLTHGMSQQELSNIDFSSSFEEKRYINDNSTPLGEGKVFTQPLDVDKIIKKVSIK